MKHTTKKMKLFLYICLGLIILNACTFEEEIIKQNGYQEKMKLESKKFSELLQLPAFSNAYKRVINKKVTLSNDLAARTALEDQYGFTIVEGKDVKIITDIDGSIYYNMLIERAVKENLKFENLVIKVKDVDVGAVILKYELNEKATFVENHDTYAIDVKESSIQVIEVEGKMMFIPINCWNVVTIICDNTANGTYPHNHIANDECLNAGINISYIVTEYCFGINIDISGGGDTPVGTGTSSGDDGFGGGGGNNPATNSNNNDNPPPPGNNPDEIPLTNNTPPIKNVIIVPDEEVEENEDDPCNKLKEKAEDSEFMAKFNDLNRNQVFNRDHETAYFESKNNNQIVYTYFQGNSETSSAIGPENTHSGMHVHNNDYYTVDNEGQGSTIKTVKMFSPKDLHTFVNGYQEQAAVSGISSMETYCMMLSSEGIYAIKLLNPNEQLNSFVLRAVKKEYELEAKLIIEVNSNLSDRKIALQKLFLKFLKKLGLENKVGLFEGTVTPSQTGNKLNWSRKSLDNNNNIVTNPC